MEKIVVTCVRIEVRTRVTALIPILTWTYVFCFARALISMTQVYLVSCVFIFTLTLHLLT